MYECETCTATFWSVNACENHMDDYDHWPECETCPKTFHTQQACNQHMNDTDHWAPRFKCETCDKEFRSQSSANHHMDAKRHWMPKLPCQTCDKVFHTEQAVNQHMRDKGHYKHYCKDCCQQFNNKNELKMHLNSRIHRGTNAPCPFCKTHFTAASGVTHHLESGSCIQAPKVSRETIFKMVRARDPQGVITSKQIEWRKENVQYSVTNKAFNGYNWECYFCHNEFRSVAALTAHLNSPVHKQKVYHCPNSKANCGKKFVTLAGLFNHLESESCEFMRFDRVQQQVGNVLRSRKLISFS